LNNTEHIIFTIVFITAIVFFLNNISKLFAIICLGRWENRFDNLWFRLKGLLKYGFGQTRVVGRKFGINHFFLFWGFMILMCVYLEFFINGIFPKFNLSFIGAVPYGVLLFTADIMSFVVIVCVLIAVMRKVFFRPKHVEAKFDAFFILSLISVLMIAYFTSNISEANLNNLSMIHWLPISSRLTFLFNDINKSDVHVISRIAWWMHALIMLYFLNYLPYSKHLHILTALPNCFFRSPKIVSTVHRMKFNKGEEFGVSKIVQFSWKDLLDFMACTECGRCQSVCPATITNKPLNPKELILHCKQNILKNGSVIRASRPPDMLASAPADAEMSIPLISETKESVSAEALWECTTCGACMQACPVFIEHTPKIIKMRQHLVMEKSEFPKELTSFFESAENRFNPWGLPPTDRNKWTTDIDIPTIQNNKNVEYLFFVGCAGAFDSRSRKVTVAISQILNNAGISWAILGNEEKCCGDSLRRLGNEFVFDKLVNDNINTFNKYGIKKIITSCPHCFSTLKNDYRQFGAELEVIHHTQFINNLINEGKIKLSKKIEGKTVFHDSCYLCRYNDVFSEPRNILKSCADKKNILEMKDFGTNSFCCGAGGGRMWMEESVGKRINIERTQQALNTGASTVAVACPYCLTMFEDGLKDEKASEKVSVRDIAEIVAESLG
jgi:Fe-S oxidoreductase